MAKPEKSIVSRSLARLRRLAPRLGLALGAMVLALALGDSFTVAVQVEYEDTATGRLEEALGRRLGEPVSVVNTAVAGWGPNHYLIEARSELAATPYDLVLVFLFVANDVVRQRVDSFPSRSPAPRRAFGIPQGLSLRAFKDSFAYPFNDMLETRSHLYMLVRNRLKFLRIRLGLYPDVFPRVFLKSFAEAPDWSLTADVAADIAAEAGSHGASAVFVLLPADYQTDPALAGRYASAFGVDPADADLGQPARLLTELLQERGLEVIDTTPELVAARAAGRSNLYGTVDTHFAPEGHRVVAELLLPIALEHLRDRDAPAAAGPP